MLKRVLLVMLLNVAAAALTQTVAGNILIQPASPPCAPGEEGFSGDYTDAGVTIKFWSCATTNAMVCHSTFTTASGDPISEVDNTTGSLKVFIAGVDTDDDPVTEEQLASMDVMFNSPEAALAENVWGELDSLGMTIGSGGPTLCLWLHSDLWERTQPQAAGSD